MLIDFMSPPAIKPQWYYKFCLASSERVPTSSLPRLRRGPLPLTGPRVAMPSKLIVPLGSSSKMLLDY